MPCDDLDLERDERLLNKADWGYQRRTNLLFNELFTRVIACLKFLNTTTGIKNETFDIIGNDIDTDFVFTYAFISNEFAILQLKDTTTYNNVEHLVDIRNPSTGSCSAHFADAVPTGKTYKLSVIG